MRIELWNYDGVGFILLGKSGVIYSTQAAGLGCEHPEEEGWFLPVSDYLGGTKATEKIGRAISWFAVANFARGSGLPG
jgi:hypothetical protein